MRFPEVKCPKFVKTIATNVAELVGASLKTIGKAATFGGVLGYVVNGMLSIYTASLNNREVRALIEMDGTESSQTNLTIASNFTSLDTNRQHNMIVANNTMGVGVPQVDLSPVLLPLVLGGIAGFALGVALLETLKCCTRRDRLNESQASMLQNNASSSGHSDKKVTMLKYGKEALSLSSSLMATCAVGMFALMEVFNKTTGIFASTISIPSSPFFFGTQNAYGSPGISISVPFNGASVNANLPVAFSQRASLNGIISGDVDVSDLRNGMVNGSQNVTDSYISAAYLLTVGAGVFAYLALKVEKSADRYNKPVSFAEIDGTEMTPVIQVDPRQAYVVDAGAIPEGTRSEDGGGHHRRSSSVVTPGLEIAVRGHSRSQSKGGHNRSVSFLENLGVMPASAASTRDELATPLQPSAFTGVDPAGADALTHSPPPVAADISRNSSSIVDLFNLGEGHARTASEHVRTASTSSAGSVRRRGHAATLSAGSAVDM